MNILAVILFLIFFVSILLGGHFFLYFSLVKFLSINASNAKIWLGGIFLFLSFSFILSSVLAHYSEGLLARITYSIFSFWLGLGWNLILAFLLVWLIIIITTLTGQSFDHKYLVGVAILGALVFSIWGSWNAYNPKIKNITVEIKDLPETWKGKKVVQLSDVHLGHIYGKKFLNNLIKKVNKQQPMAVFITGDLFDGMDGELNGLVNPLKNIKTQQGVYFVTGNHETYLGVDKAALALEGTQIKILDDELVDVGGLQVLGISYPERGESSDFATRIKQVADFNPQLPSILLYHNPNVAKFAKEAGISLQLAGHTHKGQIFPFQIITRLIYGKYHTGLTSEGDFNIYTSAGTGTWGPMMRTSGRSEIVVINFK